MAGTFHDTFAMLFGWWGSGNLSGFVLSDYRCGNIRDLGSVKSELDSESVKTVG